MDLVVELHSETSLDDKHALARVLNMKGWPWLVRWEDALVNAQKATAVSGPHLQGWLHPRVASCFSGIEHERRRLRLDLGVHFLG